MYSKQKITKERITMKLLKTFALAAMVFMTISAKSQCKFCKSYEDFIDDHWEKLDTVYCKENSRNQELWWEGNDYKLTTGNKDLDNILKKEAFIVMQADTAYLNLHNIKHDKLAICNAFTKAKRFNEHELIFTHQIVNKKILQEMTTAGLLLGAIGRLSVAADHAGQIVCYVISSGADKKGNINTRMIDDQMIEEMIEKDIIKDGKLYLEYLSEGKKVKRMLASHIIPILEKAGLLK